MRMLALAIVLAGCGAETELTEAPDSRSFLAEANGGYVYSECPDRTSLISGSCICHLGQLYMSARPLYGSPEGWECGCNPIPDRPDLTEMSVTVQVTCR